MILKPWSIWQVFSIQKLRQECLSLFLLPLMVYRQLTEERDHGSVSNGHWMFYHDIKLCNPLIVNSTQGILNAIEYLLFQI